MARTGAVGGALGGLCGSIVGQLAWLSYVASLPKGQSDEAGFAGPAQAPPAYLGWLFVLAGVLSGLAVAYADLRLRVRERDRGVPPAAGPPNLSEH
jgi:hypothetical protein